MAHLYYRERQGLRTLLANLSQSAMCHPVKKIRVPLPEGFKIRFDTRFGPRNILRFDSRFDSSVEEFKIRFEIRFERERI